MSETMKDECRGVGESRCHIAECRTTRVCQRPAPTVREETRVDEAARRKEIATVLRGFEEGVFVRSTKNDHEPSWAIKLFPYITALGQLQAMQDTDDELPTTRTERTETTP